MRLLERLLLISERWVEEQRRTDNKITLKTLASRAVGDGKTFDRIKRGGALSTVTYEKFIWDFFAVPENWPAALIPGDVVTSLVGVGCELQVQRPLPM